MEARGELERCQLASIREGVSLGYDTPDHRVLEHEREPIRIADRLAQLEIESPGIELGR